MLTIQQQDAILSGDASFYTFNTRDAWIDGDKWYYLYLETSHYKLGRTYVKYVLNDKDGVIFSGDDLGASPLNDPIGPETAEALLGFLTLGEHDIEKEYFVDHEYNERQLEFRDCEAEDLWVWREQLNSEEA